MATYELTGTVKLVVGHANLARPTNVVRSLRRKGE
jgi:hypothetical protein